MRAVNLLPEGERPAAPAQPVKGSSFVVLGVLGALVVATFAYVMTTNQISSRTGDIAQARAEIEAANARTAALGPFQRFAQIKETRLASVQQLAEARFDWERLMRELALVLPDGAWISQVTASATGSADGAAAPAPADPAAAAAAGSPSATLAGCATSQREVAVVLVRLRQLHRAAEVALADSTRTDDGSGVSSASSGGGGATAGGCGPGGYGFNATVTFGPEPAEGADAPDSISTRLGGGS